MKQIITGPMGRIAYHNAETATDGQYPALNLPSRSFARAESMVAANDIYAPNIISMPRQFRSRVALARFGTPAKREN